MKLFGVGVNLRRYLKIKMETKTFCEKAKDAYLKEKLRSRNAVIKKIQLKFPTAKYDEKTRKWELCGYFFNEICDHLVHYNEEGDYHEIEYIEDLGNFLILMEERHRYHRWTRNCVKNKQNTIWAKFRRRCKTSFGI